MRHWLVDKPRRDVTGFGLERPAPRTGLGQLDKVEFLALLGPSDVRGDERIHEGLEVGPPPLREAVADLPVAGLLALAQPAHGRQPLVQPRLEARDLLVLGPQVVARQLEEGVCDLQHQDVRVVVLVADQDALAGAPHAVRRVVLLQPLQPRRHRWVLFWLRLLDAKGVVGERVQPDRLGLVPVEGQRDDGGVPRLHGCRCDGRHGGAKVFDLGSRVCPGFSSDPIRCLSFSQLEASRVLFRSVMTRFGELTMVAMPKQLLRRSTGQIRFLPATPGVEGGLKTRLGRR